MSWSGATVLSFVVLAGKERSLVFVGILLPQSMEYMCDDLAGDFKKSKIERCLWVWNLTNL